MQAVTSLLLSKSPGDVYLMSGDQIVYLMSGDQIKVTPKNTAFPNTQEDECLSFSCYKESRLRWCWIDHLYVDKNEKNSGEIPPLFLPKDLK